jgi:gluconokinase
MVFLAADRDVLTRRLAARHGHFFPRQLLGTQFDALEPPQPEEHVVTIVPADDPAATVASILAVLCPAGDRPGACDAAGGDHEAKTGPA